MSDKSVPFLDGWFAHRNYPRNSSNPFNPKMEHYSHREWENGWAARFNAVKHELELEYDRVFQ